MVVMLMVLVVIIIFPPLQKYFSLQVRGRASLTCYITHIHSDTTFHPQLIPANLSPLVPDNFSLSSAGSHFNRQQQQQQHSHATSCRHFQLGPQAPLPMDFPMPHPGQPQSGINPHLAPPGQQHGPPLHPPLNPLPAPQFQDIPAPPFLPQALHQQYLLQQQILEAQHRHILPPSRYPHGFTGT